MQNDEGFTALHLASYRGNLRLIEMLEAEGADSKIRNLNNMTVLHTAAQGDQPLTCVLYTG
jgi:palmitoyltransferase